LSNLKDGITEKKYTQQFRPTDKTLYDESSEFIKPKNIGLLWFMDNIPKNIESSTKILDICSGPGKFGHCLKEKLGVNFKYICLDIKNLKIENENTIFIQHDIRDILPLNYNEVDIVLLFGWYHGDLWDIDYQKFLNDINRVTRMNGLLYFDFPTVENKIKFTGGEEGPMGKEKI